MPATFISTQVIASALGIIFTAAESEREILRKAFISLFEASDPNFNVSAFNRACHSTERDYWYVSGIGCEKQMIAYEVQSPDKDSAVAAFLYKSGAGETIREIEVEETFEA